MIVFKKNQFTPKKLASLTNYLLFSIHHSVVDVANVCCGHGGQGAWCQAIPAHAMRSLSNRFLRARGLHEKICTILVDSASFLTPFKRENEREI
jgi:hypothetical protein